MAQTLIELLQRQAQLRPQQPVYSFSSGDDPPVKMTYAQLDQEARAIAAELQGRYPAGERVLLVYPAGLEFISAFFGCLYAGMLAVPATYPKPRRPMPRLESIARDCEARVALTNAATLELIETARLSPELAHVEWLATDAIESSPDAWRPPGIVRDQLAFLQYTSGSTSEPRGVMVTHGNLLHNLEMIRQGFALDQTEQQAGVFWLPAYHDMGLIGGILEPLYVGGHSILMSPQSFLQRPLRWLKMISEHRAAVSGAPNFAYELCVQKITPEDRTGLDLSSWQTAFCGAEPIRAETLHDFAEAFAECGFHASSFYPCYGLAEGTLLAAGGYGPRTPVVLPVHRAALAERRVEPTNDLAQTQRLVGCGHALVDQQLVIVDPETCEPCPENRIGEIWVAGPSVAQGYWNRPELTENTFRAHLAGEADKKFLRTGDLGFLHDGQLFVTGRIKDVIIIRGRNYFPQDLETVVSQSHEALRLGAGSAFVTPLKEQERLVLVQEVDRQFRNLDYAQLARQVRSAIAEEHELEVGALVLVRHASLPRTTSGKIQRTLCREQFLAGELKTLYQWTAAASASPTIQPEPNGVATRSVTPLVAPLELSKLVPDGPLEPQDVDRLTQQVERWLLHWLGDRSGVAEQELAADRPFFEYGLDSLAAVELSQELEDWLAVRLTPVVAWNYPTPTALGRFLAEQVAAARRGVSEPEETIDLAAGDQFDDLLAEIENLSDEEAEALLRRQAEEQ